MTVRKKFTPEVLLSAPRRSSALPSPDGKLALFSQSSYSFSSHSKTTEICVLDVTNGQTTVLTDDGRASEPKWLGDDYEIMWLKESENGNTSIVVSDATELGRSYSAGTVPGPISSLKLQMTEPGVVAIAVAGQANPDGSLHNPKDVAKSHSSARLYNELFVRHWDKYVDSYRNTIFTGLLKKSEPHVAEKKGRYTLMGLSNILRGTNLSSPIAPFGGTDHFDISTHGDIVFVAKDPHLDPATHTRCTCYFVLRPDSMSLIVSKPTKLEVPWLSGAASSPTFSPDGKSVAFLQMKTDGYESDKNRIIVVPDVDKHSTEGVELYKNDSGTGDWDRSPSAVMWSSDAKSLFLVAEDVGVGCLFQVPFEPESRSKTNSTNPRRLTSSGYISDVVPAAKDSSMLFISSTTLVDSSAYTLLDPAMTSDCVKISSNTLDGAMFGLSPSQVGQLWWRGANDEPVHAWMMKPSFFKKDKRYPLAYLIHGGPQGAWCDQWSTRWNPAIFAEQGYVVITPNPTGSTSYGQAFTDAIRNEWGGLPYEDLVKGFEYIKSNLEYVDTDRAVALGASYGGYMMNWIQGHDLGRKFKALVCHDGVFSMTAQLASDEQYFPVHDLGGPIWEKQENYDKWDPSRFTKNWSTPQLVIHNELDYRLTIAEGLAAFNVLQMRGVDSMFLSFPDENHWVLKHENSLVWHRVVINWINKYVGLPPLLDKDGKDGLEQYRKEGR